MQLKKGIYLLFFLITLFVSCAKFADNPASSGNGGSSSDTTTAVKFFNVVDQGKLRIKINGTVILDSLAQYYPSD